ncbi:hypothetical protein ONS95_011567 [Cadophora gregata]|uniref:uncharacterized protein n=1 Tax=Cadophora gregata TaxID=51156 RepID=UPI0026DBA825|nr:uncharacterized protein ONS95_011567 [Cadophora gregata]KAK0120161.1 hypothetical protein ONS95_011567 [Cadophora gregata]
MTWMDVRTRASVVAKLASQDKLHPPSNETILHCGESPFTHGNGCTLDIVLSGWIPDPCFDAELYADYTGPGSPDIFYYTTQAATERIAQDVVMKGHLTGVWTTWGEHITHCEYVLKGLGRVMVNQSLGINEKYLDFEHTQHCIDAIAGRHNMQMPLDRVTTHLEFEDIACFVRARG